MKKAILIVLLLMFGLSMVVIAERAIWRYWPFEPLKMCPTIKVMNPGKVVMAGSMMIYEVSFDKTMPVACTIKRQLINSYRVDYDALTPPQKELGPQKAVSSIHVPSYADAGEWFMRWTAECYVGPENRIISITRESERFQVIR
jgi:hypothetical protein